MEGADTLGQRLPGLVAAGRSLSARAAADVPKQTSLSFMAWKTIPRGREEQAANLDKNVFDHVPGDTSQPRVEALELDAQTLVIDTQHVKHGRMEVMHCDDILLRRVAEVIG